MKRRRVIDVGAVIGDLTVLDTTGRRRYKSCVKRVLTCRCVCGVVKEFQLDNVLSGNSTSCGCVGRQRTITILKQRKRGGIQTNLFQHFRTYQRKAEKRDLAFALTQDEFYALSQRPCHYCGAEPSNHFELRHSQGPRTGEPRCGEGFSYNGVDRVDSSKGYTLENCVPACKACNLAKSNRSLLEFAEWAKRLIRNIGAWAPGE
jgi:hypothetical protein